jgi:hypothetical protein
MWSEHHEGIELANGGKPGRSLSVESTNSGTSRVISRHEIDIVMSISRWAEEFVFKERERQAMVEEPVPECELQSMGEAVARVPDGAGLLEVTARGPQSKVLLQINALATVRQQLLSTGSRDHRDRA